MNLQSIKNLATGKEPRSIRHHYTAEEMSELKEKFFENANRNSDLEEELATIKTQYRELMRPIKDAQKDLRKKIRDRFVDEDKEVYLYPNQAAGMMEFYDVNTGDKVDERRLHPSERQLSIIPGAASNEE